MEVCGVSSVSYLIHCVYDSLVDWLATSSMSPAQTMSNGIRKLYNKNNNTIKWSPDFEISSLYYIIL